MIIMDHFVQRGVKLNSNIQLMVCLQTQDRSQSFVILIQAISIKHLPVSRRHIIYMMILEIQAFSPIQLVPKGSPSLKFGSEMTWGEFCAAPSRSKIGYRKSTTINIRPKAIWRRFGLTQTLTPILRHIHMCMMTMEAVSKLRNA